MTALDEREVFFSESFASEGAQDPKAFTRQLYRREFKDFLRNFREREQTFTYRDQLKTNYNRGQYWVAVSVDDLQSHDEAQMRSEAQAHNANYQRLSDKLRDSPTDAIEIFEEAAKEVADEVTRPRREGEEEVKDIQVLLHDESNAVGIRMIQATNMSQLVKITGIVIAASSVRVKATHLTLQCRGCKSFLNNVPIKRGLEGFMLPRKCAADVVGVAGRARCPIDPYFIVATKSRCVDMQVLKLQELPESVPSGETSRHLTVYCERYLCDRAVPGNRITVMGIFCIKKASGPGGKDKGRKGASNTARQPYLRAIGIDIGQEGPGRSGQGQWYSDSRDQFFQVLAARPDIYDLITRSLAPSIFGLTDVKRAVAALLFGGSRKILPDGLPRRGDVNVLLLGDPGTAKSQLLKFVEMCSPIAVYTSGKGSSAAGLTASIIRDPSTRNFVVEGGAMVLADGGVICIDEFDKMREDDRVAIHEAMEQQTISIAKAGITTTLNSRCSVLAAANSVFGRWDDLKGAENIDFMPTILSRFDMIFIVRDEHDEQRDMRLCRHVVSVHMNASSRILPATTNSSSNSSSANWSIAHASTLQELDLQTLKAFIAYSRATCGPRLGEPAADKLANRYVMMRNSAAEYERQTGKRISIPITVRQLEAVIRISESLAKMRLAAFATEADVDEALRLFHVSTLDAALSGSLAGAEGFTSKQDQELLGEIEKRIKQRFVAGSCVAQAAVVAEMCSHHKFAENAVTKVIQCMLRRGELQYRMQRKLLYRVK